jgi:hypothetical protein
MQHLALRTAAHSRRNMPTYGLARRFHWIIGQMSIPRCCRGLGVAEQLADNDQALSA